MGALNPVDVDALDLDGFLRDAPPFQPHALYDQDMDCIRIYVRNCHIVEHRAGEWITIFYDATDDKRCVGLSLKGLNAVFRQFDCPFDVTYPVEALLDRWAKMVSGAELHELQLAIKAAALNIVEIGVKVDEPAQTHH